MCQVIAFIPPSSNLIKLSVNNNHPLQNKKRSHCVVTTVAVLDPGSPYLAAVEIFIRLVGKNILEVTDIVVPTAAVMS